MEELIPIVMFTVVGTVLSLIFYFRFRTRREVQQTIRAAVERGAEITPELMETLSSSISSQSNDLRRGVISLAIGFAFLMFGQFTGEPDVQQGLTGVAAFPIFIGIAYIGLWFTTKK